MSQRATALFHLLRRRARLGILVEGVAVLVLAVLVFAVLSYVIDRTFRLELGYRLVVLLIFAVGLGRLSHLRLLRPLGVHLDDEEMALALERADPKTHQALISAVQFQDTLRTGETRAESDQMMTAVVLDVERRADGDLRQQRAVDGRRVARYGALLLGVLVVAGSAAAAWPEVVGLWARRNLALSSEEWPRYTQLQFASGQTVRVPEGDDLTLTVQAGGVLPDQVFLHYAFAHESGVEAMTSTGEGEFSLTLQSVLADAMVHATGGDGLTPELRIEVVERPRIQDLEVALRYPAYMKRAEEQLNLIDGSGGDLDVPRGATLRVQARSTKPLIDAGLVFGTDRAVESALELDPDGRGFAGEFTPTESGLLALRVLDADRLDAATPPRLYLRLVEDRAPVVEFRPTGIGSMITPIALIQGDLEVREDHGLTELAAEYRVTGQAEEASPPAEPGDAGPGDAGPGDAGPGEAGAGATGAAEPVPAAPEEVPWRPAALATGLALDPAVTVTNFTNPVAFDLRALAADAPDAAARPGQFLALRFRARDNFGPGEAHTGESDAVLFRVVTREKLLEDLTRRQGEQRRELELVLRRERADLEQLSEILSPTADDPRAAAARQRVLTLARDQRALGVRVRSVADNYRQIMAELGNNRLLEPGALAELDRDIHAPLDRLATEDFPSSAISVQEFADAGEEDVRTVVVLSYRAIIRRLGQVLEHMEDAENLATLLEGLRETLKLQGAAIRAAEDRRREQAQGLFDPPTPAAGSDGTDESKGKKPKDR